jgi:hypothetical protein
MYAVDASWKEIEQMLEVNDILDLSRTRKRMSEILRKQKRNRVLSWMNWISYWNWIFVGKRTQYCKENGAD